ncbi:hypothetical protein LCGC14_3123650, partial [marine sediment metagenome]
EELTATKSGQRGEYLTSPVVAANPIEMLNKRCERRCREIAYGPIPVPAKLDPALGILQDGDESMTIEGSARDVTEQVDPGDLCPHGVKRAERCAECYVPASDEEVEGLQTEMDGLVSEK